MNAEVLLDHFDRISDAPDAAQCLRKFILDLAVRGKLVEQDQDDEPAALLLTRIQSERAYRAASEGTQINSSEPIDPEDFPFDLPSNWTWVRLSDICSKTGSGSTPRGGRAVYQKSGIPFLRSQNIHDDGLRLDDVAYITHQTHAKMAGTAVRPDDLLLNITGGSIGRCCRVPSGFGEANVSQHVAIIRVAIEGIQAYMHRLILSPYFQAFVLGEQTGAGRGGLPKNRMDRIPVALPPLAEQRRIVAKLEELKELSDRLEQTQKSREATRDQLAAASLDLLNNGAAGDELRENARFVINHLPQLTVVPNQVEEVRQTILNLAVRGRLVPQDAKDEPALKLMQRLQVEKTRQEQEGALKKAKPLPPINDKQLPYMLPSSWLWKRWGEIAKKIGDIDHKMPETVLKGGVPYISPRDFLPHGGIDFEGAKRVSHADYERLAVKMKPSVGDLIYPRYGTIGENRLVGSHRDFLVSYSCAVIKVMDGFVDPKYQYVFSMSDCCKNQAKAAENKTTQANVGIQSIQEFFFPLPPLSEQRRIVAVIETLMALCDGLEGQLTDIHTGSRSLLEAVLVEALKPARSVEAT